MRPSLHRCLERLEKSVSPFGPSGNRLSQHLKRAGEHLTILAGLAGAAKHLGDELGSWSADRVRPSCAAAVTRLNGGCAACERTTPAHVCRDACANAARGCLTPRYVTLYGPVSAYAKRLLRSVKGVKGELRYDSLYVRLTLEVRMALEHAQDNAQHIFKQVSQHCGHAVDGDLTLKLKQRQYRRVTSSSGSLPTDKWHSRLVTAARRLDSRKEILRVLPAEVCRRRPTKRQHCWDGHRVVSYYDKPVPKASLAAQIAENPEVEVTAKKELTVLISELEHLSKDHGYKHTNRRRSPGGNGGDNGDTEGSAGIDDEDGEGSGGSGSGDTGSTEKSKNTPPSTTDGFLFEPKYTTVKNTDDTGSASRISNCVLLSVLPICSILYSLYP